MNNSQLMFNRNILDRYLGNFQTETIADYRKKYEKVQKWKQSVDEGRFHKKSMLNACQLLSRMISKSLLILLINCCTLVSIVTTKMRHS